MASERPKPVPRKPRADAQRNRARILKIAKDAFTRSGANISLDDVARQARIGAGTLYRPAPDAKKFRLMRKFFNSSKAV
jgi:AcrR family transcriptional regulator